MKLNMTDWKEFYLKKLFDIRMGNGFDKNKLDIENSEINLVSRVTLISSLE